MLSKGESGPRCYMWNGMFWRKLTYELNSGQDTHSVSKVHIKIALGSQALVSVCSIPCQFGHCSWHLKDISQSRLMLRSSLFRNGSSWNFLNWKFSLFHDFSSHNFSLKNSVSDLTGKSCSNNHSDSSKWYPSHQESQPCGSHYLRRTTASCNLIYT